MSTAYIGIGSNLGDREKNCLDAIGLIEERGMTVMARSTMIETEPWGVTDQPKFINMAVRVETDLSPEELLAALQDIERTFGRVRKEKWGPRTIDLDILLYGDLVIDSEQLKIPHPLMHERDFALRPLAEIAPDVVHPVLKKTLKELCMALMKEMRA